MCWHGNYPASYDKNEIPKTSAHDDDDGKEKLTPCARGAASE